MKQNNTNYAANSLNSLPMDTYNIIWLPKQNQSGASLTEMTSLSDYRDISEIEKSSSFHTPFVDKTSFLCEARYFSAWIRLA